MSESVLLPGGRWRLWGQFALRGAGFPAHEILRLASTPLATTADHLTPHPRDTPDWKTYEHTYTQTTLTTTQHLQHLATQPHLKAAIAWQNRTLLTTALPSFHNWQPTPHNRTSMNRQREELLAHYWQRLTTKNDTIGFFGPVGWGHWNTHPHTPHLTTHPGQHLTTTTHHYYSSWAIDTLATTLTTHHQLHPWTPPHRTPHHHTTPTHHHTPARPPQPIDPFTRELLLLCDGVLLPAELAEALGPRVGRTVGTDEVLEALGALARRRWINWRLSIPASAHPERALRAALERVGDPDARKLSLAALDRLDAARDRVVAAGRDADALDEAMAGLEAEFAELTETPARRAKGSRTAPCRSLLYSDSRRSATVTLGPALLAELAPMSLCLTAAGWLTARYAERVGARIRETFDRLRGERSSVDLGSLYLACLPAPHAGSVEDVEALQAELRDRWTAIIDAEPGARRVWRSSEELAPRVAEAFGEPGEAWNIARYASPDVLVVAESEEAVNRGEFELVLGELHVAMNTIGASLFVNQHPAPDELLAETDRDFPGPRLMPLLPKEQPPRWSTRSRPALVRPQDYLVALAEHTGDPSRPRTVLSGDVLVEDRGGRLTAVLPDGAAFPLLDVFGNALTNRVMDRFALRPEAPHSPRITVDRMIIARETWRLDPTTLHFAHEKNEAHRFATTRHWANQLGLPRYAFALSPTEPRPFYIDFHSPIYCTILAKAIRRLARNQPHHHLTLTEMLPTPEHTWLTDDQHHHYTAELRFVTVDQTQVESDTARGNGDS